jgi:hypothetical protein
MKMRLENSIGIEVSAYEGTREQCTRVLASWMETITEGDKVSFPEVGDDE